MAALGVQKRPFVGVQPDWSALVESTIVLIAEISAYIISNTNPFFVSWKVCVVGGALEFGRVCDRRFHLILARRTFRLLGEEKELKSYCPFCETEYSHSSLK